MKINPRPSTAPLQALSDAQRLPSPSLESQTNKHTGDLSDESVRVGRSGDAGGTAGGYIHNLQPFQVQNGWCDRSVAASDCSFRWLDNK